LLDPESLPNDPWFKDPFYQDFIGEKWFFLKQKIYEILLVDV
jgi:hypothetical protein